MPRPSCRAVPRRPGRPSRLRLVSAPPKGQDSKAGKALQGVEVVNQLTQPTSTLPIKREDQPREVFQ